MVPEDATACTYFFPLVGVVGVRPSSSPNIALFYQSLPIDPRNKRVLWELDYDARASVDGVPCRQAHLGGPLLCVSPQFLRFRFRGAVRLI
jgi:hypothetical protein